MTVKNISQFHGYSVEQLDELNTRHLVEILESTRSKHISELDRSPDIGLDYVEWNSAQKMLHDRVKQVLSTREHLESTKQLKREEKQARKW